MKNLGTVRGADGLNVIVNATFLTTDPVLFDSLYVVGGTAENQEKFNSIFSTLLTNRSNIINRLDLHRQESLSSNYQMPRLGPGIVFATDNPEFEKDFVKAIAHQRFWDREIY